MRDEKIKSSKEPLIHITKKEDMPLWKAILVRVVAILIAFLFSSLLAYLFIGADPGKFLKAFVDANFGTGDRVWVLIKDVAVLLCIGIAVTPAFRMKFWNIGAEGQVLISALASVAVIMYAPAEWPEWLLVLMMLVAALLSGMIWAIIPAIFKAIWNTNETLFTLMMNYVATYFVGYCLIKWTPNGSSVLGRLSRGYLPVLGNQYLLLILVVAVVTVIMFIYMYYSKQGYEISVVGESVRTANYIGINVKKVIVRTMAISGLLCGLTGFLIVAALDHSVSVTTVGGRGFTAIIVSWLGKFNPFIMILTSFLLVFISQGAGRLSTVFRVSNAFPDVVAGIVIFFVIGCEFFIRYKLHFRHSKTEGSGGGGKAGIKEPDSNDKKPDVPEKKDEGVS